VQSFKSLPQLEVFLAALPIQAGPLCTVAGHSCGLCSGNALAYLRLHLRVHFFVGGYVNINVFFILLLTDLLLSIGYFST